MSWLADLVRDFRYSARALARTPGFTVVAVAVLALGIGANSAIFSLVSAVWLRPLPFADAERLVTLWTDWSSIDGPPNVQVAPGNYVDWQRASSFESMAAIEPGSFNLTGDGGDPERLTGLRTTPNLFDTIGVQPILGRTFLPDDASNGVVVISEGFWLRRLNGDPAAVGRTIDLDGSPHTVVGVVPRDFRFPEGDNDVFVATAFGPDVLARYQSFYWYIVAKLRAGVAPAAAAAELRTLAEALRAEFPDSPRGIAAAIVPLHEQLAGSVRPTMLALLGAVALVLLVACANVANLMLVRAASKQRELAIRKALGAARGRVLRQLLTESVLLAGMSVVAGLAMAAACLGYLTRLVPSTLPASSTVGLDVRVLALTIGAAFVTVLLFGVGPAVAAARRDFGAAFGRAVGAHGRTARRMRTALVVGEVALTVVLLAGAGLLLRSYRAVLAVDPGFEAQGVLLLETVLAPTAYSNGVDRDSFYRRVLERVNGLPGVSGAGYTSYAPLTFKGGQSLVTVEGKPPPEPSEVVSNSAMNRSASPGYVEALGVPLISGRLFDDRDTRGGTRTAVINETFARTRWPDEDPLGRRFTIGASDGSPMTVVGVVGDIRQMGLDAPSVAEVYFPLDQVDVPFMWPRQLVVRTDGDPLALAAAVRRAIWDVNPNQPVSNVRPMSDVLDVELGNRNLQLTLIGSFAVLALVLAAVGLYGVLSYAVAQGTSEIGLRMALGAEQRTVVASVVRTALGTSALGIALGLVLAFASTRTIASFLYGVSPTDATTALAVAGVLLVVTAVAAFIPALRAASVDPVTALRAET
jgi:predicted permease